MIRKVFFLMFFKKKFLIFFPFSKSQLFFKGITLQSLGGVFIATVVGLTIAMITLAVEVYNKKKLQNGKIGNEAMDKSHIKTIDIKPYKEDVDIFMKKTLDSMNRIE